ncbi:thioredoxin [Arthrobacter ruber]|uniref:thioredoxin n=1 Tax=Arthrobacter ruber TaxID=1258893 RepID=UPI000CF530C0|nr:thioredoxin [Arthrobacter ruber]
MPAQTATTSTFQAEVLQNELPVLVDFWAPWCPPCRVVGPILDQIAQEQAGNLKIVKVNVDENPELAQRYVVSSIPAFRIFNNGDVVGSFVGAMPKDAFEDRLAPYIAR